ncbi:MAG: phosphoribosylformylglycinamidine synthase, partial [Muribaculaceae bacterium]|nr:phosphoribosylformylglycinamidine synthase [Muribaculaceae bacterium]
NRERPIDLGMADMFGNSPKTVMHDITVEREYKAPETSSLNLEDTLKEVLSLEAVACKDWLTNKVDRSVTGRIARQQCQGEIQLPLSDCGVVALDYTGTTGIATSIGHAPQAALADPARGSVLAIAESLTNIVGADLARGLSTISLSANWMWPCRNEGEDAALYRAVESCSRFACDLGINIPTGKDSLSMTQKYADGTKVLAPGTVIISAAGEVADVRKTVSPVLADVPESTILYIPFSLSPLALGGSAFAQTQGKIGSDVPAIDDPAYFRNVFDTLQKLVAERRILAMHDISAGGLIVTLLEMTFANTEGGLEIDTAAMSALGETDITKILFAENPAVAVQIADGEQLDAVKAILEAAGVKSVVLGHPSAERVLNICHGDAEWLLGIDWLRDVWFRPSYLLDSIQSGEKCALDRFENYRSQPVVYDIHDGWDGTLASRGISHTRKERSGVKAAIIREKGVNGDREMAYALHLAG